MDKHNECEVNIKKNMYFIVSIWFLNIECEAHTGPSLSKVCGPKYSISKVGSVACWSDGVFQPRIYNYICEIISCFLYTSCCIIQSIFFALMLQYVPEFRFVVSFSPARSTGPSGICMTISHLISIIMYYAPWTHSYCWKFEAFKTFCHRLREDILLIVWKGKAIWIENLTIFWYLMLMGSTSGLSVLALFPTLDSSHHTRVVILQKLYTIRISGLKMYTQYHKLFV